MAWWDVPGLTPIVAFDGRPDGVAPSQWVDRIGSNHASASGISVASGGYFGMQGNGNLISFASQVNLPTYFVLAVFFNIKGNSIFGYKEPGDSNSYILDVEPGSGLYNSNAGTYSYWAALSSAFTAPHFLAIVRNTTGTWGIADDGSFINIANSTIMPYIKGIGYVGNFNSYNQESADALIAWGVWEGSVERASVLDLRSAIISAMTLPPPNPRVVGGAFRYFPAVNPNLSINKRITGPSVFWKNTQFGGFKEVSGVVTIEGIPASRVVRCHEKRTGVMVAEKWSASNGVYSFPGLDARLDYYVVAFDYEQVYNMVGKDRIKFR